MDNATKLTQAKQELRRIILLKLKTQKEEERTRKSGSIQKKLFDLDVFKQAKVIMFYVSTKFEVDTRDMIKEAIKLGKTIAVPVISGDKNTMDISLVLNPDAQLEYGPYGIKQPKPESISHVPGDELDLVVVPGLAFDKKGNRLGRGKGYYDRFLRAKNQRTRAIGLAFDFQAIDDLPHNSSDQPVEQIITA